MQHAGPSRRRGSHAVPACAWESHAEAGAALGGFDVELSAELLAERTHQIDAYSRALAAAAAEAHAIILDLEAQMPPDLLQAHANGARTPIRKRILESIRQQLVDDETERDRLGDREAAADRVTFDGKRLTRRDQDLQIVAQLLEKGPAVQP